MGLFRNSGLMLSVGAREGAKSEAA
jgi:hypothetical protein